ncbi:unnamed protein product [Parascedosporium putredinis]|uniref:Rho-GAP domain-containing protein n=1 Tax=Parascedosporium putredinis TaxID=1442378 RepID=A0A9P1H6C2_9PEZI|nr:unnamed protein product [Parascedosporium putredinis]CAI7997485.1 unnamed protein product [Parascedosporium putredinis]
MSRGQEITDSPPRHLDPSSADHSVQKPNPSLISSKSDLPLASLDDELQDQNNHQAQQLASKKENPSLLFYDGNQTGDRSISHGSSAPKTAIPMQAQDRSVREIMSSTPRNRSEDRAGYRDFSNKENHRDKEQSRTQPSSLRENAGSSTFFSGLKNSSTRAADMIRGGLFGKGQRAGPAEREPVVEDEHYVLKTINLPLIEQTRLTRISKRLEDSRDKTEFWMPAFPWRAIDYLNYKGCDMAKKIRRRIRRRPFAQDDLYDINIIGSMLKAWLRELPDELFPKAAQERIARECAGAETVPQMLIDELSDLSPFNYYLLFAITCHLSLLLAHSDKNKMDFRNLCICFQPCMKIDVFCFKFLVCNWRECWKGCKNEAKFIELEYMLFDQPPPRPL